MPVFVYPAAVTLSPLYGLLYVVAFIAVIAMAYWTTRLVSSSYGRTYGTQIRIVDRLPIGTDKNFLMIKIGSNHYFLYQDRNGVRLLDRLKDFVPEPSEPQNSVQSFREIFEKIVNRKQG